MKYVRFILLTLMWVFLLLSFIAGAFLFISGLVFIIMGGLILRFVILMIQGVLSEND